MTFESLVRLHKAEPFLPFKLSLADGSEVSITHPECLAYHPKGARMITIAQSDGGFKMVDLLLVAAAEVGNGKPRRKDKP